MIFLRTVNSRYSGHPRDCDLVSLIARVRNSGVRENFYFKPYSHRCYFSLTPVPFSDPLSQVKSVRTLIFIKNFAFFLQNIAHLCLITKRDILMIKWHFKENQPLLTEIYKDSPLLSYRIGRSLETYSLEQSFEDQSFLILTNRSRVWPVNHLNQHRLNELIHGCETAKRALLEKD